MRAVVVTRAGNNTMEHALATRAPDVEWVQCPPAQLAGHLHSVGADPVVVVGIGTAGSQALDGAADHDNVVAFVLWGGELAIEAIEAVAEWPELAFLGIADPNTRPALRGAVDAYLASDNPASDLRVGPLDDAALDEVGAWVSNRLTSADAVEEVVFSSADGWELHGTQRIPERSGLVPGVVLLHTGRSDRAAYARLERLLADAGLAVLNIDWRGRGESINLGRYFDLDDETKAAGWQDALAAVAHLAGHPAVDATRIGAVGTVHGGEYAVRAGWRDQGLKAIAILTGYRPIEAEEGPYLTSGAVAVLYVTCTNHRVTTAAMLKLHEATAPGRSQYIEYPGSPIGYQLFELDHQLEPRIVAWMDEALAK